MSPDRGLSIPPDRFALVMISSLEAAGIDLDRIEWTKAFGMVNAAPGFNALPGVINGFSDLLLEVFGEKGRHSRSAIGVAELPFGVPVELEAEVSGTVGAFDILTRHRRSNLSSLNATAVGRGGLRLGHGSRKGHFQASPHLAAELGQFAGQAVVVRTESVEPAFQRIESPLQRNKPAFQRIESDLKRTQSKFDDAESLIDLAQSGINLAQSIIKLIESSIDAVESGTEHPPQKDAQCHNAGKVRGAQCNFNSHDRSCFSPPADVGFPATDWVHYDSHQRLEVPLTTIHPPPPRTSLAQTGGRYMIGVIETARRNTFSWREGVVR